MNLNYASCIVVYFHTYRNLPYPVTSAACRFLLYRRQHKKENFETTGLSENAKGKSERTKRKAESYIRSYVSSREKIGLQKWSNVQNARRMQQIQKELQDRYGISYMEVTGHIKALRANNNYLDTALTKSQKEISDLRQLINDY